jgi:hypothetical protein
MSHAPMLQLLWFCSIVALATPCDDLVVVIFVTFVLSEHRDVFFDIVVLILKSLEPLKNY